MKTLILGVGNEFRSDDAIGLLIARDLRKKFKSLKIIESGGDGADLLTEWEGYNRVIIIDAVKSSGEAGKVMIINPSSAEFTKYQPIHASHLFSIKQAIETSHALKKLPENLIIIGITGKIFEIRNSLSEELKNLYRKIYSEVEIYVKDYIQLTENII